MSHLLRGSIGGNDYGEPDWEINVQGRGHASGHERI